jgi:hypothetical protein
MQLLLEKASEMKSQHWRRFPQSAAAKFAVIHFLFM